jgi:putative transposase
VRLYYRFSLSYRDVEEVMFERGVRVSYESIRRWCHKFGPCFAAAIRRQRPQPQDKWHLDEMYIKMNGETDYLWRAADANGMVLDILVQERRNQEAAETFLRRLVAAYPDEPRVVVTDKLAQWYCPRQNGPKPPGAPAQVKRKQPRWATDTAGRRCVQNELPTAGRTSGTSIRVWT